MSHSYDRCTKCILSAAFPRIEFDENGLCNFCRETILYTNEKDSIEKAKKQVEMLIESAKGKSEYDAVMCYSGGKDSTYTLMLAVKKYGLRVLSFTFDNGYISPTAFENIRRVTNHLGVDQFTFSPSLENMNAIIKASALNPIYNPRTLTRISSVCNSCISIVNMTALKISMEKKIPFILAGFTLGQIPLNGIIYKNNYEFLRESRETPLKKLREKAGRFVDSYLTLPDSLISGSDSYPHTLNLLCLEELTEQEIIEAVSEMGWRAPGDVDGCSSNCMLNSFSNMVHQKALGYNPYELELSHLIRKGLMTREEALVKITDQPVEQQARVMKELGITEHDIENLDQLYRKI
jgi:tRNA(Ile)-lysidine synthase TilS/MesJ